MEFVYRPEGAEEKRWEFQVNKLMSPEAEVIERMTGMTFGEWQAAVQNESVLALHALLYVMLKRENPTLKWDNVQFSMSQVGFHISDDEARLALEALEELAASGAELAEEQTAMLELLREQVEPEPKPEPDDEPADLDPEAPSKPAKNKAAGPKARAASS